MDDASFAYHGVAIGILITFPASALYIGVVFLVVHFYKAF
jgi:hypothetical protein